MHMNLSRGQLSVPTAIIVAAAFIAIAIIWVNKPSAPAAPAGHETAVSPSPDQSGTPVGPAPVTAADHILGNPNAPIKLIEYSDPSCPYCKQFNPALEQVMSAYGSSGNVAWVYRQAPLTGQTPDGQAFHPNSIAQAQAFECAGALGGNAAFFAYEKRWYDVFPIDGADRDAGADSLQILSVAKDAGLDTAAFNACLSSGRFKAAVTADLDTSMKAGITGTPYTFMVTPSGNIIPLEGIQSFSVLKSAIDTLITTIATSSNLKN